MRELRVAASADEIPVRCPSHKAFNSVEMNTMPVPSAPSLSECEAVTPSNAYNNPPQEQPSGSSDKILVGAWDTGFCSCCDFFVPNFCMAWCCPWVTVAQITARMGLYPFTKTLLTVLGLHVLAWLAFAAGYAHLNGRHHDRIVKVSRASSVSYLLTPTFSSWRGYYSAWFILGQVFLVAYGLCVWQLRLKVRTRFLIPGDWCQDMCAGVCCSCCAIAQMATHVKSYTPGSCGFRATPDTLPAYP